MPVVDRIDRYQRAHTWLGAPLAVVYKFFDDRGPYLAALVTYYGFLSLFPLLLVFSSTVGFFFHHDAGFRNDIVNSALQNFPIIGAQLKQNVNGFRGSGVALTFGIIGTLYGGMGATQAAQAAFNHIYGVPRNEQPNPITSRVRSVGILGLLGGGVLLTTGVAALVGTANPIAARLGPALRLLGVALTVVIDVGLFTAAFQLLTALKLRLREVITGGTIAGLSWAALQNVGTSYTSHELSHANAVYGTFGLVLTSIGWIYLQALVIMLACEVNVVISHRLWPRALMTPFTDDVELTDADRRTYRMYAQRQRFKGFERIRAEFDEGPGTQSPAPADRGTDPHPRRTRDGGAPLRAERARSAGRGR